MSSRAAHIARQLNTERDAFKSFLIARVGNEADAEDILQNGLVKALRHGADIHSEASMVPWFYQLLRNAVVDHYRGRDAVRRRNQALGETLHALQEDVVAAPPAWERQICACLGGVVETLPTRQAELIRRVDLQGEAVHAAARALEISPNAASVTLHRARQALRGKLAAFCGACASGACLDCHCQPE